ncbi:MAG: SGNH/GDSL hydrolase family protein, partial [Planctomycetota bacterium]
MPPSPKPSTAEFVRQQRRRRRVLILAALLSPVAAELALRASGERGLVLHTEEGKRQRRAQPPFKHVLRPGARVEVTYAPRSGDALRTAVMTINDEGLRGRAPEGGRPQIACIGDSHTFGFGVSDGEPWPAVLEKELRRNPQAARGPEVLNYGVGGYGPHQEAARLALDALPRRPDIVLWQWFSNDVEAGMGEDPPSPGRRRVELWVHPFRGGWVRSLRETSVAVDLLMHRIYRWCRSEAKPAETLANQARTSPAWLKALDAIRMARQGAESSGARFAMVVHPLVVQSGDAFASEALDALALEFCAKEGIPCVDLTQTLEPSDANVLRNSDLDYHPSPTCHALVG